MKKTVILIAAAGVLALMPQVMAGGNAGWFAGSTLGQATHSGYELKSFATSLDDTDTGFNIYTGYTWGFFAVSMGYVDLGALNASGSGDFYAEKASNFTDHIAAKGWSTSIHGIMPVSPKVALIATIGMFRWDQSVDWTDDFGPWHGSASGTSLTYGVGVAVALNSTKSLVATAQWQRYANVGDLKITEHELDITLISVGMTYYFGK